MITVSFANGEVQVISPNRDIVRSGSDLVQWLVSTAFYEAPITFEYAYAVMNWFCTDKENPFVIYRNDVCDIFTWQNKKA